MDTTINVRSHVIFVNQEKTYWHTEVDNDKRLRLQAATMHFGGLLSILTLETSFT